MNSLINLRTELSEYYLSYNLVINIIQRNKSIINEYIFSKLISSNIEKALELVHGLSLEWIELKTSALKYISTELAKLEKNKEASEVMYEAIECASSLNSDWDKSMAIKEISIELAKQGNYEEAIECVNSILYDSDKYEAFYEMAILFAKHENLMMAENTGLKIPKIAMRQKCWKEIGKNMYEKFGWQQSLQQAKYIQSSETHEFYFKGISDCVTTYDCNSEFILNARGFYQDDIVSMESLLQNFALQELFISNSSLEKINRFNRTLNIQWAIDIKNSFSEN